ncbi:MAG: GNAT family N-acetyltransferase [Thermodesulfobacteriota bacterium]
MNAPGGEREIRFARPDDLPSIVSLLGELFAIEEDFLPDPARQRRGAELILGNPEVGRILVCETGGRVAGMVSLLFTVSTAEGAPAAWLEDLVVEPASRGRGMGRELLETAMRFAETKGLARITLLVDRTNEGAKRFYRRQGFRESAMLPMRRTVPQG